MTWYVTLLAVHLVALLGCLRMYRRAPCWMQRLVMGGLAAAMTVLVLAYLAAMLEGGGEHILIIFVALALEHIAILLYLFRLNVQGMQWTQSSDRSRSLLA